MVKGFFIVLLFFTLPSFFWSVTHGQGLLFIQEQLQQSDCNINLMYLNAIRKKWPFLANGNLSVFHVFVFEIEKQKLNKDIINDSIFISSLKPMRVKSRKCYEVNSLIEINGEFFDGENGIIYHYKNKEAYIDKIQLREFALINKVIIVFGISGVDMSLRFGITSTSEVLVFKLSKTGIPEKYSLNEFFSCCKDEIFSGLR